MPTTLAAGDLAIIGLNADNPDSFSFVLLVDIDAGTEIFFTDNGVFSDGSFRTTEGIVKYTAPAAITAGTVIPFTAINGDFTEEDAGFALAIDGDQVIAYQGSVATPTFIYAAQTNSTQFQADSTSSNTSALPPGLTVGTTAVAVGSGADPTDEFDNSTYDESLTSGTQAELLAAISNAANWTGSDTPITLADGPFTVVPPDTSELLTPIPANNLVELTRLGSANTVQLDIGQFGFDRVSQIRIFSTDASGMSRVEIGSISLLEIDKLPAAYSPVFTVSSDAVEQGDFLQFELVENGQIRVATLSSIDDDRVALDFGDGDQLTVSLANETNTTDLLIDDASAIDLTGLDGQPVTIEFSVFREAAFDNTLRFYRTDFADGGIITDSLTGTVVRPGEAGYEQAAINQLLDIELSGQNARVNTFSTTIDGGDYLGMVLIVDGTDPVSNELYFSHSGANSNGADRARLLGNNTFGFEDLPNLGDRDFDDVVVEFSII